MTSDQKKTEDSAELIGHTIPDVEGTEPRLSTCEVCGAETDSVNMVRCAVHLQECRE